MNSPEDSCIASAGEYTRCEGRPGAQRSTRVTKQAISPIPSYGLLFYTLIMLYAYLSFCVRPSATPLWHHPRRPGTVIRHSRNTLSLSLSPILRCSTVLVSAFSSITPLAAILQVSFTLVADPRLELVRVAMVGQELVYGRDDLAALGAACTDSRYA